MRLGYRHTFIVGHSPDTVPGAADQEHCISVIAAGFGEDAATLEFLRSALDDPSDAIRCVALGGLGRRGALSSQLAVAGLSDESPRVRQRAAQLVSLISEEGHPTAALRQALRANLHDPVPLCTITALEAIGSIGDSEAVAEIIEVIRTTGDPLVHEEAIATLAALGDRRGLPMVLAATEGRPPLRRRSVAALGAFEGPEVEEALDRLSNDRDWQVRQAVAMLRREELEQEPPEDL